MDTTIYSADIFLVPGKCLPALPSLVNKAMSDTDRTVAGFAKRLVQLMAERDRIDAEIAVLRQSITAECNNAARPTRLDRTTPGATGATVAGRVLAYLQDHRTVHRFKVLAETLSIPANTLAAAVGDLVKQGLVYRYGNGLVGLPGLDPYSLRSMIDDAKSTESSSLFSNLNQIASHGAFTGRDRDALISRIEAAIRNSDVNGKPL
ncbi:MAG: hypothetical protein J0M02_04620 [Planctomycetes bacterium]|nr:hypothetical protein [Planctomycetota bacterium]